MEIVPGVHQVDGIGSVVNVFLVARPDGRILIDTGLALAARGVLKYLDRLSEAPSHVAAILITHGDLDHIGALHRIKQATGAQVVAHKDEAALVEGRELRKPTQPGLAQRVMDRVTRALFPIKPTHVDWPVVDGDEVFGLRVVHAPGHSPGSACYLLEKERVLFAGDALAHFGGRLSLPMKAYTTDMVQAARSVKAIAQLDFDVCCFGHGPSLAGNAQAAIREFADSL